MKLFNKLLLPIVTTLTVLPICSCSNIPKGMPEIKIIRHEHISISYSYPKEKENFICAYSLDNDYQVGEIRVWNKNSTLGEQEITDCITHDETNKTISIPAAKFWNFEYIKLNINVIKTLKR